MFESLGPLKSPVNGVINEISSEIEVSNAVISVTVQSVYTVRVVEPTQVQVPAHVPVVHCWITQLLYVHEGVGVGVIELVGVGVILLDGVIVGVFVGVDVIELVGVGVILLDGVIDGVGVFVGVGVIDTV